MRTEHGEMCNGKCQSVGGDVECVLLDHIK